MRKMRRRYAPAIASNAKLQPAILHYKAARAQLRRFENSPMYFVIEESRDEVSWCLC